MKTDEKLMITIAVTSLILVVGMGFTVTYCIDHVGSDKNDETVIDDVLLDYLVYQLDRHGGTMYTDDGKTITVNAADSVTLDRGMIKVNHGGDLWYVHQSHIVAVYV